MNTLESNRKLCLGQQTRLRELISGNHPHEEAIQLFLRQHAMLHSANVAEPEIWSYEDAVLGDMTEEHMRIMSKDCDHTITWLIWHMARCEDITMNILVAGQPLILMEDDWRQKLKTPIIHTGNAMDKQSIINFSQAIEPQALRAYRLAVGQKTQALVRQLKPGELKHEVDPARLQIVKDEKVVVEEASEIVDYWGSRTIGGLLLMPASRHNLAHLSEAIEIKRKIQRSQT